VIILIGKPIVFLLVITFLLAPIPSYAANSSEVPISSKRIVKALEKDTKLALPGRNVTYLLSFNRGPVTLNEYGEVLEGTLTHTSYILSNGKVIEIAGGKPVQFSEKGDLLKGTLVVNTDMPFRFADESVYVGLQWNTQFVYHNNGTLASATIAGQSYTLAKPSSWKQLVNLNNNDKEHCAGYIALEGGTVAEFNQQGFLTKCTLKNDTNLISADGTVKLYNANTQVEFDDQGLVIKASVKE
jgi:hypothetical protein